jgi:ferredoxin--NADP+ reductase
VYSVKVQRIKHHTEKLFTFTTERPQSLRFKTGEFIMLGLNDPDSGKPIMRAYSIVSTKYDDYLEFYSIKVPNGPLTSKLQNIKIGDEILLSKKPTGSLVIDYAYQKKNLVLLSTGTGIAPFVSMVRDPETYDKYENVYLFHTVRQQRELAHKVGLVRLQSEMFPNLEYIDTVTEEDYVRPGRFWHYIEDYLPGGFDKERDAVMVCGSPELNKYCRNYFTGMGWEEGNQGEMGDFLLERAFAG